ncbi:MAG: helix-turn-helix transcriptional regulator [Verrucomicrobia bacterium]|nr:helix-turn-helix transcriptional regulator [Verrucomicrobiota bacterium]
MSFGENLQLIRKKNQLSQERLAEMLGVSRQAVSKWELGVSQS